MRHQMINAWLVTSCLISHQKLSLYSFLADVLSSCRRKHRWLKLSASVARDKPVSAPDVRISAISSLETNSDSKVVAQAFHWIMELLCIHFKLVKHNQTRCWHVTISCQPDGRPPQPVRPWKSGRVQLAEGSNVVVLELPYSTEFGRDSRKFASGVRKYRKFSHFLTHPYSGQGKKNKYYLL